MTMGSEVFLREEQELEVELHELANSVVLVFEVKEDYRTMGRMRLFSETEQQEEALRVLAQAWHEYKATLKQIASL
jgi:hypothetical protein